MFIKDSKVMIMQGIRAGEFASILAVDGEFIHLLFQGEMLVYHHTAVKPESECVFADSDLGGE